MSFIKPRRGLWVPGGTPQIDWTNPLTAGLVSCCVATGEGGSAPIIRDLVTQKLLPKAPSGSVAKVIAAPRGMQAQDGATGGWQLTALASQKPAAAVSVLWFGQLLGSVSSNSTLFGCLPNITNASPFYSYAIWRDASASGFIGFLWSNGTGGAFQKLAPSGAGFGATSGTYCVLGTVTVTAGGSAYIWQNGVVSNSVAATTGTLTYSSTAALTIGMVDPSGTVTPAAAGMYLGLAWNRQLDFGESALISADPTNFLVFPGDLAFQSFARYLPPPATSVVFRRAVSQIGTRVGSRQAM